MLELEENKYRDKISSRAACFRKKGAERGGRGTDSGSRRSCKPILTTSPFPVISREERPDSCRKLARASWTLGKTAKRTLLAADYSVLIPVCLPWGIIPSRSGAPKKRCRNRTETCSGCTRSDASHMQSTRLAIGLQAGVARSEHVRLLRFGSAPPRGC